MFVNTPTRLSWWGGSKSRGKALRPRRRGEREKCEAWKGRKNGAHQTQRNIDFSLWSSCKVTGGKGESYMVCHLPPPAPTGKLAEGGVWTWKGAASGCCNAGIGSINHPEGEGEGSWPGRRNATDGHWLAVSDCHYRNDWSQERSVGIEKKNGWNCAEKCKSLKEWKLRCFNSIFLFMDKLASCDKK